MAAARVRTNRFLLNWGSVQPSQGSFDWGPTDRFIGRLASRGIRAVPFVWGIPALGGRAPRDSPDRWTAGRAGVAELPQGGGGALRTGRQLLGQRLPPAVRSGRQAAADPVLADLERAQSEEVLRAGQPSPGKYARLLRISHDAIKSRDPQAQIVLAGMPGYGDVKAWDFLNSLYAVPGIKDDFDAAALHPYARDLDQAPPGDRAIPRGDDEPRRRGNAAVDHRARLGIGASRPLRHQQGPRGSSADALQLLQADPEQPQAPGTCSASSGSSGAIRRRLRVRVVQLLRQRGALAATTAPRSPPTTRSGASRPRRPRPRRASPRGQPREASPMTRPRASPLPRTSPARPSSAGSTRSAFKPCSSPLHAPAALGRRPHLLRQGDRRPRKRERVVSRSFTVDTVAPG